MTRPSPATYLTPQEVAAILRVSPMTAEHRCAEAVQLDLFGGAR